MGLLECEWVLLITAWLSSWWISWWMGIRESRLVRYCRWCTVVVAIGTCCSSTLSNPTTEGSSERPDKVDSCLIPSVFKAAIPKAHLYLFRSWKYLFTFPMSWHMRMVHSIQISTMCVMHIGFHLDLWVTTHCPGHNKPSPAWFISSGTR